MAAQWEEHGARPPLGTLGWQGRFKHDSAEVVALREQLQQQAGIKGIEVIDPSEPGYAARATSIFLRDGFVLVKDALDSERLERIRAGCDRTIRGMLELDPARIGNRGSHRYSFGASFAHFGCCANWAALVDPPVVLEVLRSIFQSNDFRLENLGGDYALPGCVEYQNLHQDMRNFLPEGARLDFRDMPPPDVAVNFPMEVAQGSPVGHTAWNGVTRQIPGTQNSRAPIPLCPGRPGRLI
jgi:hypothetical protein